MNRFALSPMAPVTSATLVVSGARSNAARANVTARCKPAGRPHFQERSLEHVELGVTVATLQKALTKIGCPAATPDCFQWDIGIARFVRRHSHERNGASGPEGHTGHVLLLGGINHLKAGLHSGQHRARRRDPSMWALRVVEARLVLLQVHDELRGTTGQDSLERLRTWLVPAHPDRLDKRIERRLRNAVMEVHESPE